MIYGESIHRCCACRPVTKSAMSGFSVASFFTLVHVLFTPSSVSVEAHHLLSCLHVSTLFNKIEDVLTRASNSFSVATNVVAKEYEEARHNITRLRFWRFRLEEELWLQDAFECNWCGLNKTQGTVQDILFCLRQIGIFYTYMTFGYLVVLLRKLLVSLLACCSNVSNSIPTPQKQYLN